MMARQATMRKTRREMMLACPRGPLALTLSSAQYRTCGGLSCRPLVGRHGRKIVWGSMVDRSSHYPAQAPIWQHCTLWLTVCANHTCPRKATRSSARALDRYS